MGMKWEKMSKEKVFLDDVTGKKMKINSNGLGEIQNVTYDGANVKGVEITSLNLNGKNVVYMTPGTLIVTHSSPVCIIKVMPDGRIIKFCPPGEVC